MALKERTSTPSSFLRLFGNLIIKISRGDLAGPFGEPPDGHGNLFGQKECQPSHREQQQNSEEGQIRSIWRSARAQVLFFGLVFARLRLDQSKSAQKNRGLVR